MRKLGSDDYKKLAKALGDEMGALLMRAKEGMCAPPLEVLITGGDDELVAEFEVKADGHLEKLVGSQLLNAQFPITATVKDKNGKEWEAIISEETLAEGLQ